MARRDVRRRPGRTVLVAILVAIPVLAMTLGSIFGRSNDARDGFAAEYRAGADDIVVSQEHGHDDTDFLRSLPGGVEYRSALGLRWGPVEIADGSVLEGVELQDPGAGQPPLQGTSQREGEWPGDGQVWLSRPLAEALEASVGDTLELRHPAGTWEVSGIGRVDADFDRRLLVIPGLDPEQFRPGVLRRTTVMDVPAARGSAEIERVAREIERQLGATPYAGTDGQAYVSWRDQWHDADSDAWVAWGWVAGVIALAATGIVIAAAFATSARRQLVTVGLLSASGAGERAIRRTLALQGMWTGLAGSIVGVALGVAGVLVGRGPIERFNGHVFAPLVIRPADLAVIVVTGTVAATAAAALPARTAARVPVMAALAGRRPLGKVPPTLAPRGVAMFAVGVFLLVVAANTTDGAVGVAVGIFGGLLVLVGLCCCSPIAVQALSAVAAAAGRTWRFAGRSLGRTRARTAAVVTAVGVTGALAVAGSTFAISWRPDEVHVRTWPADTAVFAPVDEPAWLVDGAPADRPTGAEGEVADFDAAPSRPFADSARQLVEAIVPTAEWHERRVVTWDEPPEGSQITGSTTDSVSRWMSIVVADEATMDLYDLDDTDRERLAEVGMLALNSYFLVPDEPTAGGDPGDVRRTARLSMVSGDVEVPFAVRHESVDVASTGRVPSSNFTTGTDAFMITPEAAQAAGLDVVAAGAFLRSDHALTVEQRVGLQDLTWGSGRSDSLDSVYADVPAPSRIMFGVSTEWPSNALSSAEVQGIGTGLALVLTLAVVAVSLSLSAAEGRDERDTLVAVGARPSMLRRLAGSKAALISATGLALAVPAGLVPAFALVRATDREFSVPWLVLAGFVAVPLVAGIAATAASTVAQRLRPTTMSTLATD